MSTPNRSPVLTSLEQQRKLAKDLIRAARSGDAASLARLHAVRSDAAHHAAAQARRCPARRRPRGRLRVVAEARGRIPGTRRRGVLRAVRSGDVPRTRQLLASMHVRKRVNDPMFAFGQRAAHIAAKNAATAHGADRRRRGREQEKRVGERPLHRARQRRRGHRAIPVGARCGADAERGSAARLVRRAATLVDGDRSLVHARGGDGQQPLHEAKTVAIADFLLDRGAAVDVRCIDHQSTPAQYALVDRPDVCRRLLERGATPDIFMAARLGDVPLAARLLDADPSCASARINEPGYALVPPLHIYCWLLGFGLSPHEVAKKFGHREVHEC